MSDLKRRLQDQADEDRLYDEPETAELWEEAIAEIERLERKAEWHDGLLKWMRAEGIARLEDRNG